MITRSKNNAYYWKVVNNVTNSKANHKIIINENGKTYNNDEDIANIFSDYFMDKIENLKSNINQEQHSNPLKPQKKTQPYKKTKWT